MGKKGNPVAVVVGPKIAGSDKDTCPNFNCAFRPTERHYPQNPTTPTDKRCFVFDNASHRITCGPKHPTGTVHDPAGRRRFLFWSTDTNTFSNAYFIFILCFFFFFFKVTHGPLPFVINIK